MDIDDLLDEFESKPVQKAASKPKPADEWNWGDSDEEPKAQAQKQPPKQQASTTFDEYDDNEWHDEEVQPTKN